jgi:hypothetical protein
LKTCSIAVAYLSFIVFSLLVASATDEEWVVGAMQWGVASLGDWKAAEESGVALCGVPKHVSNLDSKLSLGAVVTQYFDLGLTKATEETSYNFWYSGAGTTAACTYDLQGYIEDINAATTSNRTTRWPNMWYGQAPISFNTFQATLGLLGFASFCQIVAWLIMVAFQYGVPKVSESRISLWVVRGLITSTVFFTIVPLALFGASPIKTEFCKAFDPDSAYNGVGCGFGNGYNIAIAAVVMGLIEAVAAWFYMTLDLPPAYAFTGTGSGFKSNAYEPVTPAGEAASFQGTASSSLSSNAYQDFGSA